MIGAPAVPLLSPAHLCLKLSPGAEAPASLPLRASPAPPTKQKYGPRAASLFPRLPHLRSDSAGGPAATWAHRKTPPLKKATGGVPLGLAPLPRLVYPVSPSIASVYGSPFDLAYFFSSKQLDTSDPSVEPTETRTSAQVWQCFCQPDPLIFPENGPDAYALEYFPSKPLRRRTVRFGTAFLRCTCTHELTLTHTQACGCYEQRKGGHGAPR